MVVLLETTVGRMAPLDHCCWPLHSRRPRRHCHCRRRVLLLLLLLLLLLHTIAARYFVVVATVGMTMRRSEIAWFVAAWNDDDDVEVVVVHRPVHIRSNSHGFIYSFIGEKES